VKFTGTVYLTGIAAPARPGAREDDQVTGRARRPPGRPQRGRARPLPPGNTLYTPEASDARRSLEHSSARPLLLLHQLPVWLLPVVLTGLLVTGLAVPGWIGAAALVLVAAFLGWLAAVSWPRQAPGGRLLRAAAVACVLAVAVIQALR
jgi:hypothetical protein